MTEDVAEIAAGLSLLDERLAQIGGCSDGGCLVVRPVGAHTNGGCRCWTDKYKAQRVMRVQQAFAQAVRAHLQENRDD